MGVVTVKLSGLTWNQAFRLGELSRTGRVTVEGTGTGFLRITGLNPSFGSLDKCLSEIEGRFSVGVSVP